MATKASTELGGAAGDGGAFRMVRRLKSKPGHERTLALVGSDNHEVVFERIAFDPNAFDDVALLRERADSLAMVLSPHLPRIVYTRGESACLAMAQGAIAGQWLEELTAAEKKLGSDFLALSVNLRIVLDVLVALSALHGHKGGSRPLTHGAVAPCNVLVGIDGHSRLTGALRSLDETVPCPPSYAAPEMLLGDGTADHRTDLYSASVMLWEALVGRRLFEETDAQAVLSRQLAGPLPRAVVREPWADALADVAAKGLAVDPADRHAAASEIATAIRLVAQARLAAATRVGRMVESLAEDVLARRRGPTSVPSPAAPSGFHRSAPRVIKVPGSVPKGDPALAASTRIVTPTPTGATLVREAARATAKAPPRPHAPAPAAPSTHRPNQMHIETPAGFDLSEIKSWRPPAPAAAAPEAEGPPANASPALPAIAAMPVDSVVHQDLIDTVHAPYTVPKPPRVPETEIEAAAVPLLAIPAAIPDALATGPFAPSPPMQTPSSIAELPSSELAGDAARKRRALFLPIAIFLLVVMGISAVVVALRSKKLEAIEPARATTANETAAAGPLSREPRVDVVPPASAAPAAPVRFPGPASPTATAVNTEAASTHGGRANPELEAKPAARAAEKTSAPVAPRKPESPRRPRSPYQPEGI